MAHQRTLLFLATILLPVSLHLQASSHQPPFLYDARCNVYLDVRWVLPFNCKPAPKIEEPQPTQRTSTSTVIASTTTTTTNQAHILASRSQSAHNTPPINFYPNATATQHLQLYQPNPQYLTNITTTTTTSTNTSHTPSYGFYSPHVILHSSSGQQAYQVTANNPYKRQHIGLSALSRFVPTSKAYTAFFKTALNEYISNKQLMVVSKEFYQGVTGHEFGTVGITIPQAPCRIKLKRGTRASELLLETDQDDNNIIDTINKPSWYYYALKIYDLNQALLQKTQNFDLFINYLLTPTKHRGRHVAYLGLGCIEKESDVQSLASLLPKSSVKILNLTNSQLPSNTYECLAKGLTKIEHFILECSEHNEQLNPNDIIPILNQAGNLKTMWIGELSDENQVSTRHAKLYISASRLNFIFALAHSNVQQFACHSQFTSDELTYLASLLNHNSALKTFQCANSDAELMPFTTDNCTFSSSETFEGFEYCL